MLQFSLVHRSFLFPSLYRPENVAAPCFSLQFLGFFYSLFFCLSQLAIWKFLSPKHAHIYARKDITSPLFVTWSIRVFFNEYNIQVRTKPQNGYYPPHLSNQLQLPTSSLMLNISSFYKTPKCFFTLIFTGPQQWAMRQWTDLKVGNRQNSKPSSQRRSIWLTVTEALHEEFWMVMEISSGNTCYT